jgi:TPR repeat protein
MLKKNQTINLISLLLGGFIISSCSFQSTTEEHAELQSNGSELLVVDCLLPGQIRKLGQGFSYVTSRKPIKTSSVDCEIRGGEYVSYDRADYRTALKIWLPQAQKNDSEAQAYVGEIYEKGYGLPADYKAAAHWYKKAASQGSSRAQINLGYLYEKGLGVEKDLVIALNWYRKASGLEDDDIAFASTIETAVKAEYQDELNLLRNELDNSQTEVKTLQTKLEGSRNSYHREQKRLHRLTAKLNKTSTQLKAIKLDGNTPSQQREIEKYEKKLQSDTENAKQQLLIAEKTKTDLNRHNSELAAKL